MANLTFAQNSLEVKAGRSININSHFLTPDIYDFAKMSFNYLVDYQVGYKFKLNHQNNLFFTPSIKVTQASLSHFSLRPLNYAVVEALKHHILETAFMSLGLKVSRNFEIIKDRFSVDFGAGIQFNFQRKRKYEFEFKDSEILQDSSYWTYFKKFEYQPNNNRLINFDLSINANFYLTQRLDLSLGFRYQQYHFFSDMFFSDRIFDKYGNLQQMKAFYGYPDRQGKQKVFLLIPTLGLSYKLGKNREETTPEKLE